MVSIFSRSKRQPVGASEFSWSNAHLHEQETALLQAIGVVPAATSPRNKHRSSAERITPLLDSAIDLSGEIPSRKTASSPTASPCKVCRYFMAQQRQHKQQEHTGGKNSKNKTPVKQVTFSLLHNTVRYLPSPSSTTWKNLEASFVQANIKSRAARAFGAYCVCSDSGETILVFSKSGMVSMTHAKLVIDNNNNGNPDHGCSNDILPLNSFSSSFPGITVSEATAGEIESNITMQMAALSCTANEDTDLRKLFLGRIAPRSALKRPHTSDTTVTSLRDNLLVNLKDSTNNNADYNHLTRLPPSKPSQQVLQQKRRLVSSWKHSTYKILGKVTG